MKMKNKRFISIFLLFILMVFCPHPCSCADEAFPKSVQSAEATVSDREFETKEIKIRYAEDDWVWSYSCRYADAFFLSPAQDEQGELALLSALGAASTYTKTGGRGRNYAAAMLEKCGFTPAGGYLFSKNGEKSNYAVGYSKAEENDVDHCRVQLGSKLISEADPEVVVIAVFINGYTKDKAEWLSNFNLGTGDDHKGFYTAEHELEKIVISYTEEIRQTYGSDKQYKYWITGHSRGAAIANILGVRLTEEYGQDHVYAYGFATPAYSKTQTFYPNVKNYILSGDFVPEVAPEEWGFYRNHDGREEEHKIMPSAKMKSLFRRLVWRNYRGLSEKDADRLLKELLDLADSQEKFDKSSRSRLDGENAWYEYLSDIMYGQGISLTGLADAHRMSSYITGIAAMY